MFRVRRKGEHPAQTDTCRDGVWVLSLAHVRQGPRAGGTGEGSPQWPHSCTALGKKQAQDVSSGAFLFSNLNSSSRRPFPAALSSVALRRPEKIQSKQPHELETSLVSLQTPVWISSHQKKTPTTSSSPAPLFFILALPRLVYFCANSIPFDN